MIDGNAKGIDVSVNNGQFDWDRWHGFIDFAMIKASEGLFWDAPKTKDEVGKWVLTGGDTNDMWLDPEFARNWYIAKDLGILRLAYHFGHPGAGDPGIQATRFIDYVRSNGLDDQDGIVLDFEVNDGKSKIEAAFWAHVFMQECWRLAPKQKFLTYTFPAFAEAGNCAMIGESGLFVANWNVPDPEVPVPWHRWIFWQYAAGSPSTGPDLDVFNGDRKALEKFLKRS
jgi:GH25 family lysozyme M1 (1,4-beta-N-acetylmuramidase)